MSSRGAKPHGQALARARVIAAHAIGEDAAYAFAEATPETYQVARLKHDGLKWLSGVYLPRVFGSKAELPADDAHDAASRETKREMRQAILDELNGLATPGVLTIDEEGKDV